MSELIVRALGCTVYVGIDGEHTSALLRYDPADPFAVSLQLEDGIEWMSRELLVEGMRGGAGEGRLFIAPVGDEVEVIVRQDGPGKTIAIGWNAVCRFLQETYGQVRKRDEHIDVPDDLSGMGVDS